MAGGIRDRAERLRIAEPRRNFLRFLVDHPGDGKCLALNRDGDVPAPITLREEQAALLQRLRKSRAVVRHGPAFLNGCLNLFGVETCSLGLLPFVEREIAGIAQAGIPKPLRHLPAVFEIEFLGDVPQLRFRSEEHTSELQSLMRLSYAVFCL